MILASEIAAHDVGSLCVIIMREYVSSKLVDNSGY
jgi:hypothetical protein